MQVALVMLVSSAIHAKRPTEERFLEVGLDPRKRPQQTARMHKKLRRPRKPCSNLRHTHWIRVLEQPTAERLSLALQSGAVHVRTTGYIIARTR